MIIPTVPECGIANAHNAFSGRTGSAAVVGAYPKDDSSRIRCCWYAC
jgi:hypothetical protein